MSEGYIRFVEQLDEAVAEYPTLRQTLSDSKKILKGVLPVIDKTGKHWEDYDIEIHFSENFPAEFPNLFETSDKIPKIADWHVYEDTLACCVKIHPEEILRCKSGVTVTEYIQEEVMPYLFNQTHRRVEGYYANGEYAHGAAGIYQYYSAILATGDDIKRTLHLMHYIATQPRPFRTSMCFCGGKVKFRHCHRDAYDKLKRIGDSLIKNHIAYIAKTAGFI